MQENAAADQAGVDVDGWVAEAVERYGAGVVTEETAAETEKKYDLEERTACFGEAVIDFAKGLRRDEITRPLIAQVIRSGTSIGANYLEADATLTKKDFRHKIGLCAREAKETKHWLRMLARADADKKAVCRELWQEAQETGPDLLGYSTAMPNAEIQITMTEKEPSDRLRVI